MHYRSESEEFFCLLVDYDSLYEHIYTTIKQITSEKTLDVRSEVKNQT